MILIKKLSFVAFLSVAQVVGLYAAFRSEPCQAEPKPSPERLAHNNATVTQCYMQSNIPVMGFEGKTVCLEPSGKVAWIR